MITSAHISTFMLVSAGHEAKNVILCYHYASLLICFVFENIDMK